MDTPHSLDLFTTAQLTGLHEDIYKETNAIYDRAGALLARMRTLPVWLPFYRDLGARVTVLLAAGQQLGELMREISAETARRADARQYSA